MFKWSRSDLNLILVAGVNVNVIYFVCLLIFQYFSLYTVRFQILINNHTQCYIENETSFILRYLVTVQIQIQKFRRKTPEKHHEMEYKVITRMPL